MSKYQILISVAILLSTSFLSQNAKANCRTDSTGLIVKKGKVLIIHKVEANETWFALSRKYNVNLDELMSLNDNKPLKAEEFVHIPIIIDQSNEPVGEKIQEEELPKANKTPVFYKVKKGETLYSISKKFNKSIFALKDWNDLSSEDIKEGDELIINYIVDYKGEMKKLASNPKPVTNSSEILEDLPQPDKSVKQVQSDSEFIATAELPAVLSKGSNEQEEKKKRKKKKKKYKPLAPEIPNKVTRKDLEETSPTQSVSELKTDNKKVIKKYVETGIGAYLSDVNLNQNRYYALHRNAPKGTIIKVTNTMNGMYAYVKVVGTLPDTGDNHNQIIKISEAAAKKMGVLDTYFRATLSYGVAE